MSERCACGDMGCGCSEGAATSMPVGDPVVFRHGAIRERMEDRIGRVRIGTAAPLAPLTTRDPADPAIALIDAFAVGLSNLAWNANRLWQDGCLRLTTDRDALVALAGLVGYTPRPAISAVTTLALTVDETEGAPDRVTVPRGLKFATVPGQDEMPVTFEADEDVVALRALNTLWPVRTPDMPVVTAETETLLLAGTASGVRAGDIVAAQITPSNWLVASVTEVERPAPTPLEGGAPGEMTPAVAILTLGNQRRVIAEDAAGIGADPLTVVVLGDKATGFGASAPDIALMSDEVRKAKGDTGEKDATEWKNFVLSRDGTATGGSVDLNAAYAKVRAEGLALFFYPNKVRIAQDGTPYLPGTDGRRPEANPDVPEGYDVHAPRHERLTRIASTRERARSDFAMASEVTEIAVEGVDLSTAEYSFRDRLRDTTIRLETGREAMVVGLKDEGLPRDGARDRIEVQGVLDGLSPGRRIILEGTLFGTGSHGAEVAVLARAEPGPGMTTLVFTAPLANTFHAAGLRLRGNCVSASQGETTIPATETLGTANPARTLQRFALGTGPLAHAPAPGARGYAPALDIRVGGRLFDESDTLLGNTGADRTYRVHPPKPGGRGTSEVQFAGRLPGGGQAVTAAYRTGGGIAGNVDAGRIETIMTPVLGLKSATNPIPATGGSDREGIEDIRVAAPASVRALDRVVSRGDYEAFAGGYRGVGKAMATVLRDGMREVMVITIATTEIAPPVPGSALPTDLGAALRAAGPPGRAIRIEGFDALEVSVTLALAHDPALDRETVEAAIRAKLAQAFSPAARAFGAALHASEVLAAAQAVEGVVALRVVTLTSAAPGGFSPAQARLPCPVPRFEGRSFRRGGLLYLTADTITFEEMVP